MNSEIGNPHTVENPLKIRKKIISINCFASIFISFLFLVAPAKLGSVLDPTSIGFYPLSLFEWFFSPWPSFIMPFLTGIALVLSLSATTPENLVRLSGNKFPLIPIAFLFVTSLIGLINSTEKNYAFLFIWHILGILNFGCAVSLQLINHPQSRQWFLISLAIGSLYIIILGIVQITSGFETTKEFAQNLMTEQGVRFSDDFKNRLNQRRAYATFTYPNSFAAHLIAVIPILLACTWTWAKAISPPRTSQITLTSLAGISAGIVLFYTGSRGALGALLISACLVSFSMLFLQRQLLSSKKVLSACIMVLVLLVIFILVLLSFRGRSFSSIDARLGYFLAAYKMFLQQPFFGVGLGEFYPWYLRLKPPGAEETRLVHNLFLHFLSQCGVLGGIAAVFFLAHPLILAIFVYKKSLSSTRTFYLIAALLGSLSWGLHSLCDFNIQISGTLLIVCTLPILTIQSKKVSLNRKRKKYPRCCKGLLFLLASIGITGIWRMPGERSYQILYNKCLATNNIEHLISDTETVAAYLPFSPYPWDIYGKKALNQNRLDLATQAFERASKRTPHRASYHAYLAQCYLQRNELSKAKIQITQALLWYPHEPNFKKIKAILDDL